MSSFFTMPSKPQDYVERPLKGMVLNKASNTLAPGEFLTVKNFYIREEGLEKRYGRGLFSPEAVEYPPITGIGTFWTTAGVQKNIVFDSKFLNVLSVTDVTTFYHEWEDEVLEVTISGTDATNANASWDKLDILSGDVLVVDTSAGSDWSSIEYATIKTVGAAALVLESADITDGTYPYKIRKALKVLGDQKLSFDVVDNYILFCDGRRPVQKFDGSNISYASFVTGTINQQIDSGDWDVANDSVDLGSNPTAATAIRFESVPAGLTGITANEIYYIGLRTGTDYYLYDTVANATTNDGSTGLITLEGTPTTACWATNDSWEDIIPGGLVHHGDRLWLYNFIDGAIHYRNGLIWSSITDKSQMTEYNLPLPYTTGKIRRALPLGALLVTYLSDALYIGRRTNVAGNILPYSFEKIETGGRGLVGSLAVCSHLDGHYFISHDDIYYLTSSYGLKPIGSKVIKSTLRNNKYLMHAIAVPDPDKDRIVFGIPEYYTEITSIWSYYYKVDQWAYEDVSCTMLASLEVSQVITWATADSIGSSWDDPDIADFTWSSLTTKSAPTLFVASLGNIYQYVATASLDSPGSTAIQGELVTRDIDLDATDIDKTFLRLSIKLTDVVTSTTTFLVSGSIDRGNTYKNLGTINIPVGKDEGYVNFRMTGSLGRFKILTVTGSNYIVMELTLTIATKGREAIRNAD